MDIREELLQNNPFASTAASNPWENSYPDITSLNGDVCDQIFYLINNKVKSPKTPLAGLIMGDAGSGKTHMLRRILDRIRRECINAIFANIRAFSVPESVMRDLWREIFVNMLNKYSGKTSQFSFIVSKMMNIYRKSQALKGIANTDSTDGIRYFQNELPGVHLDFLKAIFAYYELYKNEERYNAALGWFHGNSDDDHPALLGVSDRSSMSGSELEGEAEKMILSLGLILNLCNISMVVCFDQLDAMQDKVIINAWGKAATFLINDVVSMLPLAFLKNLTWRKFFLPVLADYVEARFRGNRYTLENCTLEQAHELIRVRITALFGENSGDKFEWIIKQLQGKLQPGHSPRIVLNFANDAILRPVSVPVPVSVSVSVSVPPQPYELLDGEYREECDKVAANFAMWQPDKERLLNALEIFLSHNPRFKEIKRSNDKYISITGRNTEENMPERDCVFIINTGENNSTVRAALKRGVDFLNAERNRMCLYITDKRCNFPGPDRWKAVHQVLGQFEKLGGRTLFLDQKQAIQWYGLNELIIKVKSGDVTHISGGEIRTAVMDDLKQYLEKSFSTDLLEAANSAPYEETEKVKKNDKSQLPDDDVIEKYVSEILRSSPMHFMKVEMLLGHLAGKVTITREQLLESLGRLNDKYSLFSSGDGTLVMLK